MKKNEIDLKITNALLSLMEEKDYESISITDITNKAGLSRVTYYRHFETKDDILVKFFEMNKAKFLDQVKANSLNATPESNEIVILSLFLFFKANMKTNKCLRKAHLDMKILEFLSNDFLKTLPVQFDKYVAYFMAGALFNVLINWLDNDCKDSIELVSKPFVDIQKVVDKRRIEAQKNPSL